jgi:hypothetical protein
MPTVVELVKEYEATMTPNRMPRERTVRRREPPAEGRGEIRPGLRGPEVDVIYLHLLSPLRAFRRTSLSCERVAGEWMGDSVEKSFSFRPSETAGAIMATRRAGNKGSPWDP